MFSSSLIRVFVSAFVLFQMACPAPPAHAQTETRSNAQSSKAATAEQTREAPLNELSVEALRRKVEETDPLPNLDEATKTEIKKLYTQAIEQLG